MSIDSFCLIVVSDYVFGPGYNNILAITFRRICFFRQYSLSNFISRQFEQNIFTLQQMRSESRNGKIISCVVNIVVLIFSEQLNMTLSRSLFRIVTVWDKIKTLQWSSHSDICLNRSKYASGRFLSGIWERITFYDRSIYKNWSLW